MYFTNFKTSFSKKLIQNADFLNSTAKYLHNSQKMTNIANNLYYATNNKTNINL